jgi:putative salt-induced outer membrane protein YdiY
MKVRKVVLMLAASILSVSSSHADVIVLKNGDRITGSIKKIWDAEVVIEPAYADEFSVDQEDIAYIESDTEFEVDFDPESNGVTIATFVGADADGNQLIEVEGVQMALPLMEITELEELDEFFDWSTNVDLNTTANSGNTNNFTASLTANIMLKWGRAKNIFDLLWQKERQEDLITGINVDVKDRQLFRYNLNYELNDPWFSGVSASYESDPLKGLDKRYNVLPALGYNIWNDAGKTFNLQLGAGFQSESTFENDTSIPPNKINEVTEDGGIAQFLLRFKYDFGDPDLTFFFNNTSTAAFYGRKNTVTQFNTGIWYEITDLLYLNLEILADYESNPVPGVSSEDVSLMIGFGLEFDK